MSRTIAFVAAAAVSLNTRVIKISGAAAMLALALLTGCIDTNVYVPEPPRRSGLLVSDFHFNPLADRKLGDRLAQAPAAQWDSIFGTSTELAYSSYGKDTNFLLLQSVLAAMRDRVPDPDIVFVSGDFLVHAFQVLFDASVTDHSPAAFAAFVDTTEQYLAMKLSTTFPNAQIVPTLGDWDSTGSTATYAGPGFLAAFASSWRAAVNRHGGAPDFEATFTTGGYYSTSFPVDPRGRLIVLYTQPWAAECTNGCGPGDGSLGDVELGWLESQFDAARNRGQRIWLLGHIPPGISAASTVQNRAKGGACLASIAPFYADAYSRKLYALFLKNRDLIALGIFAHEHDDDIRVAADASGNPLFGMKLVPSVTPIEANNPAFVQFAYDPTAGTISEATTWYLTNLPLATTTVAGVWDREYSFNETYGQSALDSNGVVGAVARILTQANAQAAYTTYYPSSNPAGVPRGGFTPFLPYSCALNNLTVADYGACYCGQ